MQQKNNQPDFPPADNINMASIGYGLCCICNELKKKGFAFKKMTAKTFLSRPRSDSLQRLSQICLWNVGVMYKILEFCKIEKIAHYRIPSDIFPLVNYQKINAPLESLADWPKIKKTIEKCGAFAKRSSIGVSFHPSQFIVIASASSDVRKASAADINFNSRILDMMGQPSDVCAPINIHINSNPVGRPDFRADFENGLSLLDSSALARLVIENEDRGYWNMRNLIEFLKPYRIPLTFDFLHHACNNCGESARESFMAAVQTWGERTPIFHYAESASENSPRSHSLYCRFAPPDFGVDYICQIEAKAKDFAIKKIMEL